MQTLTIQNKAGTIKLNDAVTKATIGKMIDEIGKLFGATASASGADFGEIMNTATNAVDTLEIIINSPGGSVFDGYTMFNEITSLRERGVVVTATITGMAASMASVICMSADTVRIVPHGRMMIHDASNEIRGNADAMRKAADLLDGISGDIAGIYAKRTRKDVEEIRKMMKKETWMNAAEAVANGFADAIFDIREIKPKPSGMNLLKMIFPGNEDEISKVEATLNEVESLRNDVTAFTSEVAALKADLSAKDQTLTEHVASIGMLNESITAITAEVEAKKTEVAKLSAELIEAKESAGKLATQKLAAIGQPEALVFAEGSGAESVKTITRSEFNALDHIARGVFISNGGKLKDQ